MKNALHAARKKARLTQEELEARSGVSQAVISKIERGTKLAPRYTTVVRLAKALRVKPEQLGFEAHSEVSR